jgi:hypothetical protein
MTTPEEIARERIAAELHDLYLATARRFGWPLRVAVDCAYEKLSEPAKELDRAFADWHLAALVASEQRVRELEAQIKLMKPVYDLYKRSIDAEVQQ